MAALSVDEALKTNKGDDVIELANLMGFEDKCIDKNKSTCGFWTEVYQYKDTAGMRPFKELCEFA